MTTIGAMNTFDATRQSGGELYQCRRIRLEHVSLQAGGTWASNTVLTITDPNDPNQTLPLRLCNVNFGTQAPNTWFNIVGLGNQESSNTSGYQVWVTRRNGIEVPGDCNLDGMVSTGDLSLLAGSWGKTSGATWAQGDFNGDGIVGTGDLSLLAGNWQYGVAAAPRRKSVFPNRPRWPCWAWEDWRWSARTTDEQNLAWQDVLSAQGRP